MEDFFFPPLFSLAFHSSDLSKLEAKEIDSLLPLKTVFCTCQTSAKNEGCFFLASLRLSLTASTMANWRSAKLLPCYHSGPIFALAKPSARSDQAFDFSRFGCRQRSCTGGSSGGHVSRRPSSLSAITKSRLPSMPLLIDSVRIGKGVCIDYWISIPAALAIGLLSD